MPSSWAAGKWFLIIGVLVLLVAAGCAPGAPSPTATTPSKATEAPKPRVEEKVSPTPTLAPAPVKLKVAYQPTMGSVGLWIAADKGYFREENLEVELVQLTATDQIAVLATGEVSAGVMGMDPAFFNAVLRGIDMKMVISSGMVTKGGEKAAGLVVRKDLVDSRAVTKVADLKGRTVAITGKGNIMERTIDTMMATAGLSVKDVNLVSLNFPDQPPALANKSIDAGYLGEPLLTTAKEQGLIEPLMYLSEVRPLNDIIVFVYSQRFATSNPDAAKRLTVAILKGHRDNNEAFFGSGKGKAEVIATVLKWGPVKDPAMLDRMALTPMKPNGEFYPKGLSEDLAWFVANGHVNANMAIDKFVDTQYIEYAWGRIGKFNDLLR